MSIVLEGTLCIVRWVCVSEVVRDLFSVPLGKCHGMACILMV